MAARKPLPKLDPETPPEPAASRARAPKGGKARASAPRKKLLSASSRRVAKERREKERGGDA